MGTLKASVNIDGGSLWAPYKDLYAKVVAAIYYKDPDTVPELEAALKKYKPDFISLLKNPARSQVHKDTVGKASTRGIDVVGHSTPQVLPQAMVDEALILSDMFELNELVALELLIAGQQQQPHFPSLTRGVVAVLLYYDGHRCLVNALRTLVQARKGKTWTLGLNNELVSIITKYTDQLKEEGLIMKVLDLLEQIDLTKELDKLQKNRALGGPRYRKQVVNMIEEICQSLAEIIFCWACQGMLTKQETLRLITHLAVHSGTCADGTLDNSTLTLVMALMYAIDVGPLQTCADTDEVVQNLLLIVNTSTAIAVHKELMTSETTWQIPGLKAVIQLSWAITLRTLSQFPPASQGLDFGSCIEEDEKTVDVAVENSAFLYLQNLIVSSSSFHQEEFFVKRVHNLVIDFIILMPLKVKELRNRGDETARIIAAHVQEGLESPVDLPRHFEQLLELIAELYSKDPLGLELISEYWCPDNTADTFTYRPIQRQVSLYKFVRLAGDLLPASLFVPYMKMLTSLSGSPSCAHHCFNLLKMNGRNAGIQCSIVSWDHFFDSIHRYYTNLRQDAPMTSDTQHLYRQRPITRGITPQEVDGLTVVLGLMENVVYQDEMARIAIAENPQFVPIVVFLGLVSCSVPPELKAALLKTLSAFARTVNIAATIWHHMENSQLIPVRPVTGYHPMGIQMDLEEVEARNEEFPITRAILGLIHSLFSSILSEGSGTSSPSFNPYLEFVRDCVFLRFHTRAYKNEGEKWEVAALCLRILEQFLRHYDMSLEDFLSQHPGGGSIPSAVQAGYAVMAHLLQDGGLLKIILLILDEGVRLFDQYSPILGQNYLEESTLLCLKLLEIGLMKQEGFMYLVRESGSGLIVTGLDRLLMGINPRSGQADHLIIITKYLTFNTFLMEHALAVTQILNLLCLNSQTAQQLVGILSSDLKESDILLHGFVECLDSEDIEKVKGEGNETPSGSSNTRSTARQLILQLLLTCLKHPPHNLAHMLLGFDLRHPIPQTTLQDPGVLGSPRTCLHATLAFLDRDSDNFGYPSCISDSPKAASLAYQLIYTLCANKDTSGAVMRYLRTTHDFLYRHLQFLPFKASDDTLNWYQQSWLLRAIAVELRLTVAHHQRSHVQRLLSSLLEDTPVIGKGADMASDSGTNFLGTSFLSQSVVSSASDPTRRKLMKILDTLSFTESWPSSPGWEYFDSVEVEKLMKECEVNIEGRTFLVDIKEFHRRLVEVMSSVQSVSAIGQRPLVVQEVRSILQFALERNKVCEILHAKQQLLEAWRLVTEVIFTACPVDIVGSLQKHQVILEISQELLQKVLSESMLPEATVAASGVILTLMTTLHHSFLPCIFPSKSTSVCSQVGRGSQPLDSVHYMTYSTSLVIVLKGILESLMNVGGGLQRVRANYYSALLNLLRIIQRPSDVQAFQKPGVGVSVLGQISDSEKLHREYLEVILGFGEPLMETVCRDACGGHQITRMLALASLDTIISLDSQQILLNFMVSKGYLRHLIDSILKDDEELQKILTKTADSIKSLYIYESKMSLLARIGGSSAGAIALLQSGVFGRLAECGSLDLWPQEDNSMQIGSLEEREEWMMPNTAKCYQQVLMSALKVILVVLTSLGLFHKEAIHQMLNFVAAHVELFSTILRQRRSTLSLEMLEHLSLVTALLSRAPLDERWDDSILADTSLLERRSQLSLLRYQLLAMLPNLINTTPARQTVSFSVYQKSQKISEDTEARVRVLSMQVAANIISSCCTLVSHSGRDAKSCRIILAPTLSDATTRETYYTPGTAGNFGSGGVHLAAGRPPGLGWLINLLQQSCSQLQKAASSHKSLLAQQEGIEALSSEELAELLPEGVKLESSSRQQQRDLVRQHLLKLSSSRKQEVNLDCFIIESALFLLWRHLEYFLLHCVGDEQEKPVYVGRTPIRRLQEQSNVDSQIQGCKSPGLNTPPAELRISTSDLEILKKDVQNVLDDALFKKLHSVEQNFIRGRTHVSFVEALLRRIKRLVKLSAK
ncbi:nuclear pore complex protein Nup205 isoform X1 [Tachypleus tridentatus]|uniref:nuclear pore complex protein Nup205 isoform X1 n=1 Tax=Tachypleus tridentatus TaxID=6853 RepID=UPI003FD01217